ncbi:hypothetical protein BGZ97_007299 [Linnemannia gamsii]|uniref:DUF4246 domain-containing protein n=1 Tax=Linnemannia gamsii TaxID=64522 RepID=A0A9P6QT45_9FUNG|nr:hypothetical protein BGZ97_007299 [Linnemannia gamsii]
MRLRYPWTGEGWWSKIKDPEIVGKWRQEILAAGLEREVRFQLREEQLDYIFKELEWHAQKHQDQIDKGAIAAIDIGIEGTRRSDGLIPEKLKSRLLQCAKNLEEVPEDKKDWHPGSNNQVLDLIHPSLFPFVAGRTRVTEEEAVPPMEHITAGKVLEVAPAPKSSALDSSFYSKKYQWLPTDFTVSPEGKVKAKSYINNLHPGEHKDMYPVLEEILEKLLPMFEETLSEIEDFPDTRQNLWVDEEKWYEPDPEFEPEEEDEADGGESSKESKVYVNEDEYYRTRLPLPVNIPEFYPRLERPIYDLKSTGKPLQFIVKLANIELSPDSPEYEGGAWHVEGMANENIVATGIYYYHCENITESRLDFRIQTQEPHHPRSDDRGTLHLYGLTNYGPLVQYMDGIITKEGRCIVFPNILQHQVQSFKLLDPTKPGSRKILAFFLVNPEEPVLSTTFVPPQQRAWDSRAFVEEARQRLPPEMLREVDRMVDWPMDLKEAREHREELMAERRSFVKTVNEKIVVTE